MFKFYISSLVKWYPLLAKNHLNFTITLKYSQLQDLFSFGKWDRHEKHFISQNVERIVLQISLLSLHYIIFHIFPLVFVFVRTFFSFSFLRIHTNVLSYIHGANLIHVNDQSHINMEPTSQLQLMLYIHQATCEYRMII